MAIFKFTHRIFHGKEIDAYGFGKLKRDFTYVTDVVDGILSALDKNLPFEIINLGNETPHEVNYLISLIEKNLGKKAIVNYTQKPPGDVDITYADTSKAKKLLNYNPKVKIEQGVKNFVEWYLNEGSKFFPEDSIQK
jgi:UDP-glucuronate 4-epimerase